MNQYLIEKYGNRVQAITLEILVPDTSGTYYLPDNATLRNKQIVALAVPGNPNDNINSPMARPVVSDAAQYTSYLTLKENSDAILDRYPMSIFLQTTADKEIYPVDFCNLNPQSSFIQVASTGLITAGESFLIVLYYLA